MAKLLQASFTGGELSPKLFGRVDLARWATSLRTCRNFIVQPYGGVMNRAGLQYVQSCRFPDKRSKLIPFVYSTTQTYMLEFAEGFISVYVQGAPVNTSTTFTITNVTLTFDGSGQYWRTITTSAPHGLSVSDGVTITGIVATGSYSVNGSWTVLAVPSSTTFHIKKTPYTTGSYTSGGSLTKFVDLTNSFTDDELSSIRWTQSADVLTTVHPDHPPLELRRLAATSFEYEPIVFSEGPFLDVNTDTSLKVHASAVYGSVSLTATGDVFEDEHEGGLLYLEEQDLSNVPPWEPNKQIAANTVNPFGLYRRSDGKVYKCVTDQAASTDGTRTGTVRPIHTRGVQSDGDGSVIPSTASRAGVEWLYVHSGYGVVRIDTVASATSAAATVLVTLPASVVGGAASSIGPYTMTGDGSDATLAAAGATSNDSYDWEVTYDGVIQDPELYSVDASGNVITFYTAPATGVAVSARQLSADNRTDVWALGAWSEEQGYPSTVAYYGDRLVFANTRGRPQTKWLSQVADYHNYGKSTPLEDSDAITITLNARQINAITDLVPMDSLISMTSSGSWRMTEGQDQAVTPSTVGFKPQLYRGAENIPAKIIGDSAVYVQTGGTKVRDLRYQFEVDKFAGNELSMLSEHLFSKSKTIVAMDFAEEPDSVLWMVLSDGSAVSLTYVREHDVIGWARHDTAGGFFEDVAVVREDNEDRPYFVVRREIGEQTVRYVERLASRAFEDQVDAFFVDCGLTYDGRNTAATTMTISGGVDWTDQENLTLTASASAFASGDVTDQIHIGDLRLTITAYTGPTIVTVRANKIVPVALRSVATTDWGMARNVFSGMDHLEGETVKIFADANVLTPQVVEAGSFTLPVHAVVVHAGLGITADIETLDVNLPNSETVRGTTKNIPKVALLVHQTRGIFAGKDEDTLTEYRPRQDTDSYDPIALMDGVTDPIYIQNTWDQNGRVFIRQTDPLPITVLAVIPDVNFGSSG